ncbi:thiol-disulfide oxidoreductase DCC family protein [Xenophilus sp. Marseille-Q4582]|uniref:thiol-disulfide oxidoreductase DCC family protein n=1 Tax=Xenophilus sp. Marseille-Q4582 TaxID=2866600 RepID=UPI001CE46A15|nr:DUF393 domain-containing protein [Xenophilus sp. Marseille-Q4582]
MQALPIPVYPLTLYYDGSCRLCSAEIRNLQTRDHAGRLRFVDCSPEGFTHGPAPRAALMDAIHAVDAAGQVYVGVPTFRVAYAAVGLDGLSALLGLPGVRQWAARAYPVLVRNRYRLPAWLIEPLFERASRRAAERAQQRSAACHGGACTRPAGPTEGGR